MERCVRYELQLFYWTVVRNRRVSIIGFKNDQKKPGKVCAVLANNRLSVLLRATNCKMRYSEITCVSLAFVHSQRYVRRRTTFLFRGRNRGSHREFATCVRLRNRGNSCRASPGIRYTLSLSLSLSRALLARPPRLPRVPEFRATRRNFGQRERNCTPRILYFAGPPIAKHRITLFERTQNVVTRS